MTPDALDVGQEPPRPPTRDPNRDRSESLAPKPLLASEALKDELAPHEPLARAAKVTGVLAGAWFAATALAPAWRPAGQPWLELAAGALMLAASLAPLSYGNRALAILLCGVGVTLTGIGGSGPASVLGYAVGEWGVLYLIAAVSLPAALLFRSHYRAYHGARPVLASALVLCLPFAILSAFGFDDATPAIQVTSGIALAALGVALLGFMGSQASLSGGALAAGIVAAIASPVPAHAGARLEPATVWEWLSVSASSLAFAGATGVAALGGFQLLAERHWKRARAVDVHPVPAEQPFAAPSAPSLTDTWNDRR